MNADAVRAELAVIDAEIERLNRRDYRGFGTMHSPSARQAIRRDAAAYNELTIRRAGLAAQLPDDDELDWEEYDDDR